MSFTPSIDLKRVPFNALFNFGKNQKSYETNSDEYGGGGGGGRFFSTRAKFNF